MKIANIYPIENQKLYKHEQVVMILAHLVKAHLYDATNFNDSQFIIMDNGLYEKAQVSTSLQDCIDIAEQSGIPVNEIIVPDVVNDLKGTKKLFWKNLKTMWKYRKKYSFMFVAQSKTYEELNKAISFANFFSHFLNITVGISKLTELDRTDKQAIQAYARCKCPIHFLGIKTTFSELVGATSLIRSCDSSQLANMCKNHKADEDVFLYKRTADTIDIDLANDKCSPLTLRALANKLNAYEFLR